MKDKSLVKLYRQNKRLTTKAPKVETPKNIYNKKKKHKKKIIEDDTYSD